jgi:hypothetical protein
MTIHPNAIHWQRVARGLYQSEIGCVLKEADGKWWGWPDNCAQYSVGPFNDPRAAQVALESAGRP